MSHSPNFQATTFYIVRHGETDWNIAGRMQGHADITLNDKGRLQAIDLASRLHDFSFTSCYSSDLRRAHETAEIVLNHKRSTIEIQPDKRLRERHFGDWEGKLFADYERSKPEDRLNMEKYEEILERVIGCLEGIVATEKAGTILILTHGGIIRDLLLKFLKLNQQTSKISVKNTGYVKLVHVDDRWTAEQMHNIEISESGLL